MANGTERKRRANGFLCRTVKAMDLALCPWVDEESRLVVRMMLTMSPLFTVRSFFRPLLATATLAWYMGSSCPEPQESINLQTELQEFQILMSQSQELQVFPVVERQIPQLRGPQLANQVLKLQSIQNTLIAGWGPAPCGSLLCCLFC
ncbi:hypothetical protein JZ751_024822 [Albula glossodonta]|uniref:Uncharacterized protein n=1 Tax=Albula glossodonta TaxID=121402 RepID=A0A8T2PC23_9TELE|nr:hypothetical protein JZ751_024822 [Albula glossodonta]